jgi:hypothetical protein
MIKNRFSFLMALLSTGTRGKKDEEKLYKSCALFSKPSSKGGGFCAFVLREYMSVLSVRAFCYY